MPHANQEKYHGHINMKAKDTASLCCQQDNSQLTGGGGLQMNDSNVSKVKKDVNILSNPHKYSCLKNDHHFKMKVWGKNGFPGNLMTCVRFCSEFPFKFIDQLAQISILA